MPNRPAFEYIVEVVMKIMIKTFIILGLILVWSGPAAAIDKSKKDEKSKDSKTVEIEKKKPDQTTSPRDSQRPNTRKKAKNYDNFIDRNNNGIDDRAEKSTPKQKQPKPAPESKPGKKPKP